MMNKLMVLGICMLFASEGIMAGDAGLEETGMNRKEVEKWGVWEYSMEGPSEGNPFMEVELQGTFRLGDVERTVDGFYDGDGMYCIRFMPDQPGEWSWTTQSNRPELDSQKGMFTCIPPSTGNHGPVRVHNQFHFAYADGTPYTCVGTTCYAWIHQGDALAEQTLETLADAPFNKLRMMLLPKNYTYCKTEPLLHVFEGGAPAQGGDLARFNPAYFQNVEKRIAQLGALEIEADLIFLTGYDYGRWAYDTLPQEVHLRLIRYAVARFAAYRNVWWSLANEYNLMKNKSIAEWEEMAALVKEKDPYGHLLSIHNCGGFYDYTRPWVTHCSIQTVALMEASNYRKKYNKPIVYDEIQYEGNVGPMYGNLTASELVHRFWLGFLGGAYVGHGEMFLDAEDVLWWSKGGVLRGQSAPRIAFLRKILEDGPTNGLEPIDMGWNNLVCGGQVPDYYLQYFGNTQSSYRNLNLPEGGNYTVDVIDTWNMTLTRAPGTYSGNCRVEMPSKPWHALRVERVPD